MSKANDRMIEIVVRLSGRVSDEVAARIIDNPKTFALKMDPTQIKLTDFSEGTFCELKHVSYETEHIEIL